jgi:hypothetical protein
METRKAPVEQPPAPIIRSANIQLATPITMYPRYLGNIEGAYPYRRAHLITARSVANYYKIYSRSEYILTSVASCGNLNKYPVNFRELVY